MGRSVPCVRRVTAATAAMLSMVMVVASACASTVEDPVTSGATTPPSGAPGENVVSTGSVPGSAAAPSTAVEPSPVVSTSPGVPPEGFVTTAAVATAPDGSTCELCVWLADTADRRSRGLMFVTDLGPADAMAFRYPRPHTGSFWMKNTLLPLSIAFYSPDGVFMEAFDMEPCTSDPCPSYRTPSGFLVAVEAPQGSLDEFGLVEGSTLDLLDLPCDT